MRSPFDDRGDEPSHLLLVNEAGEQSLWPAFAAVPAGWRTVLPASSHSSCVAAAQRPAPAPQPDPASQGDER